MTPTRVGNDGDWTAISAGTNSCLALKTDGSLWAWGGNREGELGLGDTQRRLKPVRVGTRRAWTAVATDGQSFALKADGSLWAWGWNYWGDLGLGDTHDRLKPTRVGVTL